MTTEEDIIEPFRIALKLEKDGREFFLKAARETQSRLARQTFAFLAKEENRHIEKIEAFYAAMQNTEAAELPLTEDSDAEDKLEAFNQRLEGLKAEFEPAVSDLEAYRFALEFENGAEDFYEDFLEKSDNPRVRKFYRWLIHEEKMHARLLKSCLKFVEDPAEWFKRRKA
ncbi:MAG: ferritin family protein [candidate division Zixibacteria bacterium]|nr:ferritin family protein [candidate division Zixibacteria bacterium]